MKYIMKCILLDLTIIILCIVVMMFVAIITPRFYFVAISCIGGMQIGDWMDKLSKYLDQKLFKED